MVVGSDEEAEVWSVEVGVLPTTGRDELVAGGLEVAGVVLGDVVACWFTARAGSAVRLWPSAVRLVVPEVG
jgi:hypothetical protein